MEYIKHYYQDEVASSIYFMAIDGTSYARLYFFKNDNKTAYLDSLSVSEDVRKKGIGTELQKLREGLAKEMGYKYVVLWVKKGTWMRNWYKRRGYKYLKPYKEEKAVWLRKKL